MYCVHDINSPVFWQHPSWNIPENLRETLQAGSSKSHNATSLHSWQPNMAMRTYRKNAVSMGSGFHLSMLKSPLGSVFFPGAPIHPHGLSLRWQSLRKHHHPGRGTSRGCCAVLETLLVLDRQIVVKELL